MRIGGGKPIMDDRIVIKGNRVGISAIINISFLITAAMLSPFHGITPLTSLFQKPGFLVATPLRRGYFSIYAVIKSP